MALGKLTTPIQLAPSPLGTKEYWDNLYDEEIANHIQDAKSEGTIWFDDANAVEKILDYLEDFINHPKASENHINRETSSILDLGTGNGHLLFRLRNCNGKSLKRLSWNGQMMGVDYSKKSIEFAQRIAIERKENSIEFKHWDIMNSEPDDILKGSNMKGWDIVLDKGTFDAISLSPETDTNGRRICENYRNRILPLIKTGGILLITSCNWTEMELKSWFHGPGLTYIDKIEYKSFSFGGQTGQKVSSICLLKGQYP
ncbi:Protein-lysine N-methyltransferase efm4 [Erysiphe necator]|uniref:Protein-lysine N-methyltransferase EFM4 n=1 Tax=Uncinula necator TaxID=52586 RepID=A0A0B1PGR2_UNCNE|nr:Protein-lysine N-methyltransferase efm4 [Erysiphe necator]KHJ36445.1 putative s-adenosylmethionine-dependent methyltransferase of the seven beta-strand family [Erysiphe necator]